MIEHYANGRRVYTLAEASEINRIPETTLRQRIHRAGVEAAGWINGRLPVYHPADVGLESALPSDAEDRGATLP